VTVIALEGDAIPSSSLASRGTTAVDVWDEATAASALRLALTGVPLTIRATAPRAVLDALYDDLRRITRVDIRTSAGRDDDLADDERALLDMLADGLTVPEAAARLHLSQRTAERRLAEARAKLGAATTIEAIARSRR
jgi:DNA-binding NarL/FixJ family response regulator